MERTEKCLYCQKNPATISRKDPITGADLKEYYCQACYQRLFLTRVGTRANEVAEKNGGTACPVCGRTAKEFFATGLVGCANCYRTMAKEIYPTILKLQGDKAHCGRKQEHPERLKRLIDERDALRSGDRKEDSAEKLQYLLRKIDEGTKKEER